MLLQRQSKNEVYIKNYYKRKEKVIDINFYIFFVGYNNESWKNNIIKY
jgi:hypothetical protein